MFLLCAKEWSSKWIARVKCQGAPPHSRKWPLASAWKAKFTTTRHDMICALLDTKHPTHSNEQQTIRFSISIQCVAINRIYLIYIRTDAFNATYRLALKSNIKIKMRSSDDTIASWLLCTHCETTTTNGMYFCLVLPQQSSQTGLSQAPLAMTPDKCRSTLHAVNMTEEYWKKK